MSENQEEEYATARQEIEKLRLENSKLKETTLFHAEVTGQMRQVDVKIKQIKSLLIRAADVLEKRSSETDVQLIEELRKAAQ
jgi:hypothetical protein